MIDASSFSAGTAYLAANRYQLDDMKPYLYKTSDYGATWTLITNGIPATEFARVLREDPERGGLLYAGTERGVWVSFDDGANWQSLRRNLPIVPVHDLAIKEGDLIAATHGRSFWILDDRSALRQLSPEIPREPPHLFKPRKAYHPGFWPGGGTGAAGGHPSRTSPPSRGACSPPGDISRTPAWERSDVYAASNRRQRSTEHGDQRRSQGAIRLSNAYSRQDRPGQ